MTLAELEEMATQCNPTLAQAAATCKLLAASTSKWPLSESRGRLSSSEIGNEGRAGQQGAFIGQEVVTAGKTATES